MTEKGGAPLAYAFHLLGQILDEENLKGRDKDAIIFFSYFPSSSITELIQYYLWSTCRGPGTVVRTETTSSFKSLFSRWRDRQ